jgi:hypothetical protein
LVKLGTARADSTECRLLGKFVLPTEFTLGKKITFTVMKESLLFQNVDGLFLAVDTNPNTLLATQIMKSHTSNQVQEGKNIKGCQLRIVQASSNSSKNFKAK